MHSCLPLDYNSDDCLTPGLSRYVFYYNNLRLVWRFKILSAYLTLNAAYNFNIDKNQNAVNIEILQWKFAKWFQTWVANMIP